jgi:hypothetical protein
MKKRGKTVKQFVIQYNFLFTYTYLLFAWSRISWACFWIISCRINDIRAHTTLYSINSCSKKQVICNWSVESNCYQRFNQVNVMSHMRWNKNFIFIQSSSQRVQNPANSVNKIGTWRGNSKTFSPLPLLHRTRQHKCLWFGLWIFIS